MAKDYRYLYGIQKTAADQTREDLRDFFKMCKQAGLVSWLGNQIIKGGKGLRRAGQEIDMDWSNLKGRAAGAVDRGLGHVQSALKPVAQAGEPIRRMLQSYVDSAVENAPGAWDTVKNTGNIIRRWLDTRALEGRRNYNNEKRAESRRVSPRWLSAAERVR